MPLKTDTNGDIERRIFSAPGFEVRQEGDAAPVLVGYAAVFDELSEEMWGFQERIAPGAFAKSLGGDVRALFNHDPNLILGRTRSKTLRIKEDQRGLLVEIDPPDTQLARDLVVSMRRGDVDQMSFGFRTKKDSWDEVNGKVIRTLIDVELFDVSPVTFPAYPQTDIAVRSLESWRASMRGEAPDFSSLRRRLDLASLDN